jgi:hypothetical protein
VKPRALAAALAVGLATAPGASAPMGAGVEPVTVLTLASEDELDFATKTFTNALRQRVLDAPEHTIGGESPMLYLVARDAKCSFKFTRWRPLDESDFGEACLRKIAKHLDVKRFFWGVVATEGGRPVVRLHLWQEGQPDRAASLPYDEAQRDRIAERLYRKLVTPDKVGDATVSGQAEGELFIDGKGAGPYVAGVELTLPVGDHELEVRQGSRAVARGRASITRGGRTEARLERVAEPAPSPPPTGPVISPPITAQPKASAWPWVLGGTAAAGLVGAGVLWSMRESEARDLAKACPEPRGCPSREGATIDRANAWAALAGVSFGVGVAAGAGLAAYLLTPRRGSAPISGAVVPLAGGAAVGIVGSF